MQAYHGVCSSTETTEAITLPCEIKRPTVRMSSVGRPTLLPFKTVTIRGQGTSNAVETSTKLVWNTCEMCLPNSPDVQAC